MALYEPTIRQLPGVYPIETPLTPQKNPVAMDDFYTQLPFEVEDEDIYGDVYGRAQPPASPDVHQRMGLILLFVVAIIIAFAFGIWGLVLTSSDVAAEQIGPETGEEQAAVVYDGSIAPLFTPEVHHWAPQIVKWAAEFDLDPNMVATVMQIESCGDPQAVSRSNAQGLFQVMPFHFAHGEDMLDPDTNARRGMAYLVDRIKQTNGDTGRAFAGYNGGHVAAAGSWEDWVSETQRYYTWSTGIYADAQGGATESETLQKWLAAGGSALCRQAAGRLGLR